MFKIVKEFVSGAHNGNTLYTIVIQHGYTFAQCRDIMTLERDEASLQDAFYDWAEMAWNGEEGYDYWQE